MTDHPQSGRAATDYDIAAIRRLLLAAFTPETLRRFCQDRPTFQAIMNEFGPGQGLSDMVDRVISCCRTQLLFDELLAEIEQENPKQYERLQPYGIEGKARPGVGKKVLRDFGSEKSKGRRAMDAKRQALKEGQAEIQVLLRKDDDRLARLEVALGLPSAPAKKDLEQLYRVLTDLRTSELSRTGKNVETAQDLAAQRREICLTVDFSDIHNYASAPSRTDPECAFDVFVFEKTCRPLYLLPGTLTELKRKMTAAYHYLLRVERGRAGAEGRATLAAMATGFFDRILDLFERNKLAAWPEEPPYDDEVQKLEQTLIERLERIRPRSSVNNRIDALNMALVAFLTSRSADHHPPVAHLSSTPAVSVLARDLHRLLPSPLARARRSLFVVEPQAWALNLYYSTAGLAAVPRVARADVRRLVDLPVLVRDIGQWLAFRSVETLPALISGIRSTRQALVSVEQATAPFHAQLVETELGNFPHLPEQGAATNWKERFEWEQEVTMSTLSDLLDQFEEEQTATISTLSDLLDWIEPLEQRYAPFRGFGETLRKSEKDRVATAGTVNNARARPATTQDQKDSQPRMHR